MFLVFGGGLVIGGRDYSPGAQHRRVSHVQDHLADMAPDDGTILSYITASMNQWMPIPEDHGLVTKQVVLLITHVWTSIGTG